MPDEHIVFFDGECAGCNGFARWVLRRDRAKVFKVAPLQGELAHQFLGNPDLNTVVLKTGDVIFEKSEAVLRICSRLVLPWSLLALLRLVPRAWRDLCYDFVASRRHWLWSRQYCALLRPDENARVLR